MWSHVLFCLSCLFPFISLFVAFLLIFPFLFWFFFSFTVSMPMGGTFYLLVKIVLFVFSLSSRSGVFPGQYKNVSCFILNFGIQSMKLHLDEKNLSLTQAYRLLILILKHICTQPVFWSSCNLACGSDHLQMMLYDQRIHVYNLKKRKKEKKRAQKAQPTVLGFLDH